MRILFGIRHPASGIRHPASGIRHPASGIRSASLAAWPILPLGMILLGSVLLIFALGKAVDPRETERSLTFVFGSAAAFTMSRALIFYEIVLAAALVANLWRTLTLAVAAATFAVFVGWIAYLWIVDAPVGCGCGASRGGADIVHARVVSLLRAGGLLLGSLSCLALAVFTGGECSRRLDVQEVAA